MDRHTINTSLHMEDFAIKKCIAQGVRRVSLLERLRAAVTPAVPCHGASEADRAAANEQAAEIVRLVFQQLVASLQVCWQLPCICFDGGLLLRVASRDSGISIGFSEVFACRIFWMFICQT